MRHVLPLFVGLLAPLIALAEPGPAPREVRFDRDGDRLPEGALARLGSRRFRDPGAERLFVWDSGKVVACFNEATVRWWDLESGRYLRGWAAPGGGQTFFSPDGRVAAVASDGRIEVWNAWNDRRLRTFEADTSVWVVAAVSPDGRTVAVGTTNLKDPNGSLRVWDVTTGAERLAGELNYYAESLGFADGGRQLIVGKADGAVVAWDIERRATRWQRAGCSGLRVDRTGRWFVTEVGPDWKLVLHAAATGRPAKDTEGTAVEADCRSLSDISPDGRKLLVRTSENLVSIRLRKGAVNEVQELPEEVAESRPNTGAFFPDGRRAVVPIGWRLEVIDFEKRKRLTPPPPDWGQLIRARLVSWSADGRSVITWNGSSFAGEHPCAWDPTTGRLTGSTTEQDYLAARRQDPANFYGWSAEDRLRGPIPRDTAGHWRPPNGSRTITADRALMAGAQSPGIRRVDPPEDREARLGIRCMPVYHELKVEDPSVVEVWTGRPLLTLRIRHAKHLALSPDGRSLAVGQPDGVHLYDVLSGRELLVRQIPAYPRPDPTAPAEFGMSFSPDGTRLAVIEAGGSVLVFEVTEPRERSPLKPGEYPKLWADLASDDPRAGWAAVCRLCDDPTAAARFLNARIKPVGEPAGLPTLVQDLNAPGFRAREAAAGRLLAFGDAARPAVAAALKGESTVEARERLEHISAALSADRPPQPVDLQRLRALVVLERANTPDARAKIREVAHGMSGARVTREATRAAGRLADASWDR